MRSSVFPCLLLALLVPACGGNQEHPSSGRPVPFAASASADTPFGDIPWPSDLYLDATGHIGNVPALERVLGKPESIQAGLSALDGFGRSSGALFFLDAEVDPKTLPHDYAKATDE